MEQRPVPEAKESQEIPPQFTEHKRSLSVRILNHISPVQ